MRYLRLTTIMPRGTSRLEWILFTIQLSMVISYKLQFDIEPEYVEETNPNDLHLSCRLSNLKTSLQILIIRISKQGHTVASVYNDITEKDSTKEIIGHVEDDGEKSYLNVTLRNQGTKAVGQYQCGMDYLDEYGMQQKKEVSLDIKERKPDLWSLENIVKDLVHKVKDLENDKRHSQYQTNFDRQQIASLKYELKHQKKESEAMISDLNSTLKKQNEEAKQNISILKQKLEKQLESHQKLTKQHGIEIKLLKEMFQDQEFKNDTKVTVLGQGDKAQQNSVLVVKNEENGFENRVNYLEKEQDVHDNKLNILEQSGIAFGLELNKTKDEISDEISELVTKDEMTKYAVNISSQINALFIQIDAVVKNIFSMQNNGHNKTMKQISGLATKAELKVLGDKMAKAIRTQQQRMSSFVHQEKLVDEEIDQRIRNLKLSMASNDILVADLKSNFDSTVKSLSDRIIAVGKIGNDLKKTVEYLNKMEINCSLRLKHLDVWKELMKSNLKSYINDKLKTV